MGLSETLQAELERQINEDDLTLPTLPEIAIRIRETVENPDATLTEVGKVIGEDAALTARIVRIANSPLMRGIVKVDNLQLALSRLGINYIKNITTGLAMEQIFQATNEIIDERLRASWEHSKNIAAISSVIAKNYTKLPVDKVSLAGLVHEIGVLPILTFLENQDEMIDDEAILEQLISRLHPKIGQIILTAWDFPEELMPVPVEYQNYQRETKNGKADYSDIIMVANIESRRGSPQQISPDTLTHISAFQRLQLNAENSILADEQLSAELADVKEVLQ